MRLNFYFSKYTKKYKKLFSLIIDNSFRQVEVTNSFVIEGVSRFCRVNPVNLLANNSLHSCNFEMLFRCDTHDNSNTKPVL